MLCRFQEQITRLVGFCYIKFTVYCSFEVIRQSMVPWKPKIAFMGKALMKESEVNQWTQLMAAFIAMGVCPVCSGMPYDVKNRIFASML